LARPGESWDHGSAAPHSTIGGNLLQMMTGSCR
jgi:hypothetical protein